MLKKTTLSLMLLISAPSLHYAQGYSDASALFLTIPPGSRANALGLAFTAVADDIHALYFNPAGMAGLNKGGASFYRVKVDGFWTSIYTAGVYSTRYGNFGFAFNNFDLAAQSWMGEKLNSYERAFQLSYANQLGSHVALGGTVKLVQQKFAQPSGYPDASASAWGFDLGVLVHSLFPNLTYSHRNPSFPEQFKKFARPRLPGVSFGLALLNTGPDGFVFIDENQEDPLPQILRLGVAFNALDTDEIGVLLAFDLDKLLVERKANGQARSFVESWFTAWDNGFDNMGFGAEIELYHIFAFRFGRLEFLNFSPNNSVSEWTFGLGLGPEWARLNLVRRSIPTGARNEKWLLDFVLHY